MGKLYDWWYNTRTPDDKISISYDGEKDLYIIRGTMNKHVYEQVKNLKKFELEIRGRHGMVAYHGTLDLDVFHITGYQEDRGLKIKKMNNDDIVYKIEFPTGSPFHKMQQDKIIYAKMSNDEEEYVDQELEFTCSPKEDMALAKGEGF